MVQHNCITKALPSRLAVVATCSCGAYVLLNADNDLNYSGAYSYNRFCPATTLAWARLSTAGRG